MNVSILLFATLKDRAGTSRLTIELKSDAATLDEVRAALGEKCPPLQPLLPSAIGAVNKEFAFDQEVVHDGDEVAFFPPVSGGSGDEPPYPQIIRLADAPFSTDELIRAITVPATGAVCVFSGMVRGETQRGETETQYTYHLEYESYETMALEKMQQVAAEIRARWPGVQGIAIVQRVGRLEVGENTVLIACASGHRDGGCFEAARYGIDRLKEIVPVWKREVGVQGERWVEGHYHPTQDDRSVSG